MNFDENHAIYIFFYLNCTKVQQENIGWASFEKNKRFLTPKKQKKKIYNNSVINTDGSNFTIYIFFYSEERIDEYVNHTLDLNMAFMTFCW